MALEEGGEIDLYVDDIVHPHVVARTTLVEGEGMPAEVRRRNAQRIAPTNYERLTLVTCWAYSARAQLIDAALPMPSRDISSEDEESNALRLSPRQRRDG